MVSLMQECSPLILAVKLIQDSVEHKFKLILLPVI